MVYFLKAERLGLIKIGFTAKKLRDRLDFLQSSSPDKLVVLKTVMGGGVSERRYHKQFETDWSHNEWFHPSEELTQFIASLPASNFDGMKGRPVPLSRATMTGRKHSLETRLKMRERWRQRKALKTQAHI